MVAASSLAEDVFSEKRAWGTVLAARSAVSRVSRNDSLDSGNESRCAIGQLKARLQGIDGLFKEGHPGVSALLIRRVAHDAQALWPTPEGEQLIPKPNGFWTPGVLLKPNMWMHHISTQISDAMAAVQHQKRLRYEVT